MNNQQQVTVDGAPVNNNTNQQQQQQYPQMVMQQSVNAIPQQPLYNDQAQRYPPQQQQQQQNSNESSPTRPSADAAALQAHQQRPSAQNQQQQPPQQQYQQMQQTQQMQQQQHFPRGGNTAPSQSGQNGPQGPPVMSQNGRKKIYQIRGAPFEVDPHFEIIKAIGVGAYGLVCSATDTVNKRYVAIKKMPKLFEDLIDGRRVLRELRILRWLGHHPNILQYYGVSRPRELSDQERNTFREVYFVTELLDADLSQLLISRQRLSIEHHAFMTFQLLCSLAYMHNANVIHRDLKPSNILVNANCEIRLCDFGLSRANVPFGMMTQVNNNANNNGNGNGESDANNNNNQQPQVVGGEESVGEDPLNSAKKSRETIRFNNPFNDGSNSSPSSTPVAFELTEYVVTRWYRPPELLLGIGYHHAVDLWSIGCILMEIITRRPLFAGSDYLNQLEKIAEIVPMPAPNDVPSMLMRTKNVEPARCIDNLRVMWNQSHYARPSRSMPDLEQVMEKFNYPQVVRRLMRLIKLPPDHAQPSMPMAKAVDLIAQLLTFHMGLRPTALQALRHPFLALHANDQIIEQKTKFSPEHVQNCLSQYQSIPAHQRGGAGAFQAFFSGRSNAPPFDMWAFDRQSRVHENELRAEFWVDMCMNN